MLVKIHQQHRLGIEYHMHQNGGPQASRSFNKHGHGNAQGKRVGRLVKIHMHQPEKQGRQKNRSRYVPAFQITSVYYASETELFTERPEQRHHEKGQPEGKVHHLTADVSDGIVHKKHADRI